MAQVVLDEIRAAWNAGKPLSSYIQSRKDGRYLPQVMAAKHGLDAGAVEDLIEQWLVNGIVTVEMVDRHTKAKGLKVVGTINSAVG